MARYGNSGGTNRGKKYIRLTGNEVATPENEARARAFLDWYGRSAEQIRTRLLYRTVYDPELCSEVVLHLYDRIALGGLELKDPKFYFLRTYHTARLAAANSRRRDASRFVAVEECRGLADVPSGHDGERARLAGDILRYVRANYDEAAVSLFEMYSGLGPKMSYRRLAEMIGEKPRRVQALIAPIRADVGRRFVRRLGFSAIYRVKNGVVLSLEKNA